MMLSDMVISMILKKGVLHEARNFEAEVEIPDTKIKIKINIEHMTLRMEKAEKD